MDELRRSKRASEIDDEAKARAARLEAVRLRLHKMASQREFAHFLGASYAQYNNWERGYPIPQDYIKRIVDTTPEIDADWLLFGYTRAGISSQTLALLSPLIDARLVIEAEPFAPHSQKRLVADEAADTKANGPEPWFDCPA